MIRAKDSALCHVPAPASAPQTLDGRDAQMFLAQADAECSE
ncbi:hypothetical protein OG242_31590 [Streptomyces sp. NBC_00727]